MYLNLGRKGLSFGQATKVIDGQDINAIRKTIEEVGVDKPLCGILDTVKGKGVSFMEHPSWHCKVPTEEEYETAMKELGV